MLIETEIVANVGDWDRRLSESLTFSTALSLRKKGLSYCVNHFQAQVLLAVVVGFFFNDGAHKRSARFRPKIY